MDHQDARFLDLLRKWQSGDFTRRDEQEMHTLTESDDFRRETWQGLLSEPEADHEGGLAHLRTRLRQRYGAEPARPSASTRPMWMAAAAAMVLLLAAVFFFRKNGPAVEDSPSVVAQEGLHSPAAPTAGQADIAATEQAESAPDLPSASSQRAADRLSSKPAPTGTVHVSSGPSSAGTASGGMAVGQAAPASAVADELVEPSQMAKEEEKMSAERQADVVVAEQAEKKKATAATAAKPLPTTPPSKAQKDTLWSPTGTPPDMGKRRKAARDAALPAQSGPADSWEAFQDYLRQTARLTPTAKEKGVSGTVRLQFTVSENGEPQGFLTLRSVGYGCDQEAIRLVKDWVWVRGQNPVVTVEVPFVR